LQDRFQLRSRFSRPGLPHVPLVQDPPASLEASLAAPPRKPRNPARKRVTKKLKVSETTPQEVSCLEQSSRVPVVGDSPRGPLKQRGNPRLIPQPHRNTLSLTMQVTNHAGRGPRRDPDGPPRQPF
jgi:hypothetical protein